jgi:uncharacterized protein (TIGR03435 family)
MQELAGRLPMKSLIPVVDETGLEGRFKIDLRFSTSLATNGQDPPMDPPLGAALAKLGLRVEKRRGTAKIRVLDHIEFPDEN